MKIKKGYFSFCFVHQNSKKTNCGYKFQKRMKPLRNIRIKQL